MQPPDAVLLKGYASNSKSPVVAFGFALNRRGDDPINEPRSV